MSLPSLDRRGFLAASATAAGGLLLRSFLPASLLAAEAPAREPLLGGYVRIERDGRITIWARNPEMGQGVRTALPALVAEELDVDLARVHVEQAPLDNPRFGGQGSGGSSSVSEDGWLPMRQAGAAAREMLIAAAASRWSVAPAECSTREGVVSHPASGRSISYGEVAGAAAALPVPASPRLKDPKSFRLVGKPMRSVDALAIVTGQARYGLDVRRPGMVFAAVVHSLVAGGRPRSVDGAAALAVPGVMRVLRFEGVENPTHLRAGVAVLADSTWAAFRGRDALAIEWDAGMGAGDSSDGLLETMRQATDAASEKVLRRDGDFDAAFTACAKRVEALYELPFLAHAQLEPQNCFAHFQGDRCEIEGPLQMPGSAASVVARATGLPREAVSVLPTRLGGGFGRRLMSDHAGVAARLSQLSGRPVLAVWTRPDDLSSDYFRTAGVHRFAAGLDAAGRLVAWRQRVATLSRYRFRLDASPPESTEVWKDSTPRGMVGAFELGYTAVRSAVAVGPWRAPGHNLQAFAVEGFLDELAEAAGKDPLAFRLELYGAPRKLPYEDQEPPELDTGRLAGVLRAAAERAGWGEALPRGEGLGLAAHFTFGSYAAVVARVALEAENRLRVKHLTVAVDCGYAVNPLNVEAQAMGAALDGLGAALQGEVRIEQGRAVTVNFKDYRLLRNPQAPEVDVVIVPSDAAPSGMGEIALPPTAAALANAVARAGGPRLRRLPVTASGLNV